MPHAIEHPVALDAVSHLYALGLSTTTEEVAELLDRRGDGPVDTEALRDILEELADKRELGRIQTAPHEKGRELCWTTSYFPVAKGFPGAALPGY
jgi:hypothetical protein